MTSLVWAGIAAAAFLALVVLWAWLWPRRISLHVEARHVPVNDWPDTSERVRAADEDEWQNQALANVDERDQEGGDEVVPWPHENAEEAADCVLCTPTGPPLDVIAEPDRRRAEHMNRTLRRAEGGDER